MGSCATVSASERSKGATSAPRPNELCRPIKVWLSVSRNKSETSILMLTSRKPNPIPIRNCDASKSENRCVQGVMMLFAAISTRPSIRMDFGLSLFVNRPAIITPIANPADKAVNIHPALSNETPVCCASRGKVGPGKMLSAPAAM